MIQIRPIQPGEQETAKRIVYRVAHEVFQDAKPLEEAIAEYEARGELGDMDDIQASYFENGGIFLVMTHREEMIGTGAIRRQQPKDEDNGCRCPSRPAGPAEDEIPR